MNIKPSKWVLLGLCLLAIIALFSLALITLPLELKWFLAVTIIAYLRYSLNSYHKTHSIYIECTDQNWVRVCDCDRRCDQSLLQLRGFALFGGEFFSVALQDQEGKALHLVLGPDSLSAKNAYELRYWLLQQQNQPGLASISGMKVR